MPKDMGEDKNNKIEAFSLKPKSGGAPRQLFVLLHGMGQNGEQMIDHFSKALADRFPDAEILAPQGFEDYTAEESSASKKIGGTAFSDMPNLPCLREESKGENLRQWFSLAVDPGDGMIGKSIQKSKRLNKAFNKTVLWMRGMDVSLAINAMIDKALAERGLDERHLAIIGYSQGGAITPYIAVNRKKECAAVVCHSGVFHGHTPATSRPHTLILHGLMDKIIPHAAADRSARLLENLGVPVTVHKIESLGHRVNDQSLKLCTDFIATRLEKMREVDLTASRKKGWWIKAALLLKKIID